MSLSKVRLTRAVKCDRMSHRCLGLPTTDVRGDHQQFPALAGRFQVAIPGTPESPTLHMGRCGCSQALGREPRRSSFEGHATICKSIDPGASWAKPPGWPHASTYGSPLVAQGSSPRASRGSGGVKGMNLRHRHPSHQWVNGFP